MARFAKKLPTSIRVTQDPLLLEEFKSACVAAFTDWFGFDIPTNMVMRALERMFVATADDLARALPTIGPTVKMRPPVADREKWQTIEDQIAHEIVKLYRPRRAGRPSGRRRVDDGSAAASEEEAHRSADPSAEEARVQSFG